MGKPYAEEISRLAETYVWALVAPLDALSEAVRAASPYPLVAVGSGGSHTSAHFAAAVHRQFTSGAASAMTPLEAVATPQTLRGSTVMLLTAGGKNPDVIGSYKRLLEREPRRLVVLCASTGSPLSKIAAGRPQVDFIDFRPPTGKDGFLATNSLIASAVLLVRAYAQAGNAGHSLPPSLDSLLGIPSDSGDDGEIARDSRPLWGRRNLVVLYGPATHPAAVDFESKFSEAALGAVQLADFRNFAHGRHHWLAKRGEETGVLALVTEQDRELAGSLLAHIPKRIPTLQIFLPGHGVIACLAALARVLMITGYAGESQGVDPGDPGVPAFGRRIYHLRAFGSRKDTSPGLPARETAAIERKSGSTVSTLRALGRLEEWRDAHGRFLERISAAAYAGIVLDYDGTLCDERHRFDPLPGDVVAQFERVLLTGAVVGVATGRGKSVKKALRGAIDRRHWQRVVVGYYNGGDVALLDDDARPDGSETVDEPLQRVAEALLGDPTLSRLASLTFRRRQITVELGPEGHGERLWEDLQHLLCRLSAFGVTALRSSHSIDIVAPGVCKRTVIERVGRLSGRTGGPPVLCIGDRGRWPGNDTSLLSGPYSLSADEVSPDPASCWNLAEPGCRGPLATIDYLGRLMPSRSGLRFKLG